MKTLYTRLRTGDKRIDDILREVLADSELMKEVLK
jgi:hypothetical protein